ncbi:hypothetical protein ACQEVS_19875 [Streptomyces sp. CA-181903]|uniref:hypothetical protein n=1 Tax=Streptomyces sp. CA-181903 TaxID=3240055 RepID=UPI003D8AF149
MNIRPRVAVVTASLALAGGAVAGFAAPASASVVEAAATPVAAPAATAPSAAGGPAALTCGTWRYLRGDNGHGASITCYGQSFSSYVVCHRADGIDYVRVGDRVRSGHTSTAWCDLNGEVVDAGAIPG